MKESELCVSVFVCVYAECEYTSREKKCVNIFFSFFCFCLFYARFFVFQSPVLFFFCWWRQKCNTLWRVDTKKRIICVQNYAYQNRIGYCPFSVVGIAKRQERRANKKQHQIKHLNWLALHSQLFFRCLFSFSFSTNCEYIENYRFLIGNRLRGCKIVFPLRMNISKNDFQHLQF